ncbi:rhodanese-like domain-containing protein [Paenibacillus sabuli]|uniref:rhodanese-like domain-containing protein n=1 Tax=Paenibacillus sabuli TaxID=2772509 RepID=UPI0037C8657D
METKLKRGEKLNLIDVRELDEWTEGHIAEARHLPLGELPGRVAELYEDEDAPLVLVCRSGGRSGKACDYLSAQGYNPINMQGGMLAWSGGVKTGM